MKDKKGGIPWWIPLVLFGIASILLVITYVFKSGNWVWIWS